MAVFGSRSVISDEKIKTVSQRSGQQPSTFHVLNEAVNFLTRAALSQCNLESEFQSGANAIILNKDIFAI